MPSMLSQNRKLSYLNLLLYCTLIPVNMGKHFLCTLSKTFFAIANTILCKLNHVLKNLTFVGIGLSNLSYTYIDLFFTSRIQNKGVFDLIKSRKLYKTCETMPKELMSLDAEKAIAVFMESKDINKDSVVSKLQSNNYYLFLVSIILFIIFNAISTHLV